MWVDHRARLDVDLRGGVAGRTGLGELALGTSLGCGRHGDGGCCGGTMGKNGMRVNRVGWCLLLLIFGGSDVDV